VIVAGHAEFEIIGPPEIHEVDPRWRYFSPHPRETPSTVGNLGPLMEIAGWKPARQVTIAGVAS
jgi:hypothetical protein